MEPKDDGVDAPVGLEAVGGAPAAEPDAGVLYEGLDVVGFAEESARAAAQLDRERYRKFLEAAERVAIERGLVASGRWATHLLLESPLSIDMFGMEFMSSRPDVDGKVMVERIFAAGSPPQGDSTRSGALPPTQDPEGLAHFARLDVKAGEAVVAADARDLVRIRQLTVHKGAHLKDVVIPSEAKAQYVAGAKVLSLGPEIQLIEVLRALCDPARAGDWPELLEDEARLRRPFLAEARSKIQRATGGARRGGTGKGGVAELRRLLSAEFLRGPGRVVVGRAAVDPEAVARGARAQVVTSNRFEDEEADLRRLAERCGLGFSATVNDPRVLTDPDLRRLTGHLIDPDGKKMAFVDVFDAGRRELIPFGGSAPRPSLGGEMKIGSPFVRMRFALTDLWTMQLILKVGAVPADFARGVLHEAVRQYERAAADVSAALRGPRALAELFPHLEGRFIGRWVDPGVQRKRRERAGRRGQAFRKPFMPVSSKGMEVSPKGMEVSPKGMEVSPKGMEVSPKGMEVSPKGMEVSPKGMEVSPKES